MSGPGSKPALGRGLGTLLQEPKVPPQPGADPRDPVPLTPGVGALMRGTGTKANLRPMPIGASPGKSPFLRTLLKVSLLAADVLLLGLVTWILLGSDQQPTITAILLCTLAILMGAWLAVLAVWWD